MPDIHFQVVMPNVKKIDQMVDSAILPGTEGDFEVLPGHATFVTKLRSGVIRYTIDTENDFLAVHEGFVTVEADNIMILTEDCEHKNEIDATRAQSAKERAEKRIANKSGETAVDYRRAEAALQRAVARLSAVNSS